MLLNNNFSHATFFSPLVRDQYSTFVEESSIVGCLHELQVISPLPSWKMYPKVDL
jgi:hypothetical protein